MEKARNVAEILFDIYGVNTTYRINPEVTEVGIAPVKILKLSPKRVAVAIVNLSSSSIWVSPVNDVSDDRGILLAPNGGSTTMIVKDDFQLQTLEWFGVANVANRAIFILETYII